MYSTFLNHLFLLTLFEVISFGFPIYPSPSARQLAWQEREIEALIHFGLNTFTGQEWGSGKVNPQIFNPPNLDAAQWVKAAKSFNAKSITLVAKHHDGFCLWPTKYTDYSVKSTPWRKGGGDLVREVSEACRKAGIGFGIYLSPGDRHEPSYGRNSRRYNDFFCKQLTELLTNYGEITQVFLDGAQPVRDRKQDYDWPRYYKIIRELQPMAVITVYGPDVRWVGNEDGIARETEWSVIPLPVSPEVFDWKDMRAKDIGSKEKIERTNYLHWYPAIADVSLRRGWYWKSAMDYSVKSPEELLRIYECSVGRNAGLQLNIAPDNTGHIPDRDVATLNKFGELVRHNFAINLCSDSNTNVQRFMDEEKRVYEMITLADPAYIRYVVLHEDITHGQNIERVDITLTNSQGKEFVYHLTTVGWKRIIKVNSPDVIQIHVLIQKTRGTPHFTVSCY